MTPLEKRAEVWHSRKFGAVDGPATIRKLCEEVGELAEAVCLGDPRKIQ